MLKGGAVRVKLREWHPRALPSDVAQGSGLGMLTELLLSALLLVTGRC